MTGRLRFIFPFALFLALSYYFTAWNSLTLIQIKGNDSPQLSAQPQKSHFSGLEKKCSCLLSELLSMVICSSTHFLL